ncbi:TadE/TadG family type IV pilus assembly protein [Woodsholea maritima]|uniref:TadE/TadG family type IV pilus assembly protein n=1 Tax=Woodsholea maritima TaxID=240237 RepID=UPI0003680965|nr:TadE/TadG family type IV pilus assembly protein [Woodsholea maritima]
MLKRLKSKLEGFKHAQSGAAAVEFALIALPFFVLLFAILETALMFATSSIVENATQIAARTIRTGQVQNANSPDPAGAFHNTICRRIEVIADCARLSVDVRQLNGFGGGAPAIPMDSSGNLDTGSMQFDPGDAGEVVLVRVFYRYKFHTPNVGQGLANLPGNEHLIMSTTAFKNEPFK